MKKLILSMALMGLLCSLGGQSLQQQVSLTYSGERLDEVLADISHAYQVRFSYSPDFIPVSQRVHLKVRNQPLSSALDDICDQVPMKYAAVGGQILLKPDRSKEQLGQLNTLKGKVTQTSPIYPEPSDKAERERLKEMLSPIEKMEGERVIQGEGHDYRRINYAVYRLPEDAQADSSASYIWNGDRRLAQISLLPFLGTNADESEEITNNVSFNVLWGTNGGVDGLEVGGLVNNVKKDVNGMQIAGLGNNVGGNVEGTQVGGLFNVSKGNVKGVQLAGLVNTTKSGHAIQAAGLGNIVKNDYRGLQVGGLFNHSGGNALGTQVAGLFNYSYDSTGTQLAGLFNIAGDVNTGQVSAIFNKGAHVKGPQFALINIADTICGTPIGLINIVRKGYNRIEISSNDILYANAGVKFGAHKFYNILHLGARWDKLKPGEPDAPPGTYMSWALGYGIGNTTILSPRLLMNFELAAMHVNEQALWTSELNLLNQVRLTFDMHKPGSRMSFFIGPVGNVLVSGLKNPETGVPGHSVLQPHYTLLDEKDENTSVRAWVGLQAGIRF
jgi:hypothetical protein